MIRFFKISLSAIFICIAVPCVGFAQISQGLIFGEIELKNGKTLKGQIRWDNEQGLWSDVFNAIRHQSPVHELLGERKAKEIKTKSKDFDFGFMQLWEDKVPDSEPLFSCSFGDIKYLKSSGGSMVLLGLKGGHTVKLDMDRNGDLDDRIFLYDKSSKRHVVYFKDITIIRFSPFDLSYPSARGNPMYASVLTSMGIFEGFISWDSEERFGKDDIEGKNKDKKVHIPFKEIIEIQAQDDGSLVSLKSGKKVFLNHHDDVDDGNHGIIVMGQEFGNIEIEWENFISAKFKSPKVLPESYDDFKKTGLLRGAVEDKKGDVYKGQLIYNLNKMYGIEFLRGESNEFEYFVPFYKIKKIEPQNDKYSLVTLKDSTQLLLDDDDDVTDDNGGIIIKSKNGKSKYMAWENIKTIEFE